MISGRIKSDDRILLKCPGSQEGIPGDFSLSSEYLEEIDSDRLDANILNVDFANCEHLPKLTPIDIGETVKIFAEGNSDMVENSKSLIFSTPNGTERIPPTGIGTIRKELDKIILTGELTPNQGTNSNSLLSVEQLGYLLKRKRKFKSDDNQRFKCCREHCQNPDENKTQAKIYCQLKSKISIELESEQKLPKGVFFPDLGNGTFHDLDPICSSRLTLKPCLKRKMSHVSINSTPDDQHVHESNYQYDLLG